MSLLLRFVATSRRLALCITFPYFTLNEEKKKKTFDFFPCTKDSNIMSYFMHFGVHVVILQGTVSLFSFFLYVPSFSISSSYSCYNFCSQDSRKHHCFIGLSPFFTYSLTTVCIKEGSNDKGDSVVKCNSNNETATMIYNHLYCNSRSVSSLHLLCGRMWPYKLLERKHEIAF